MTKQKKTGIILTVCLIILAAVLTGAYFMFRDEPLEGAKNITVYIDHLEGEDKTIEISTDAEFLRGALEEQKDLISGEESEFGLFVKTVDGETADDSQQQWWCFTKNGDILETGVDSTVIADGEKYEITLTVGW